MWMLSKICERSDGWSFRSLYITYVQPILLYGQTCWAPNSKQMESLEKIQKIACRIICAKLGYRSLTHYKDQLRLLSLRSIRHIIKLKLMKDLNKAMRSLNDRDQKSAVQDKGRHGLIIEEPFYKRKLFDRFYYNNAARIFNSLPRDIRQEIFNPSFTRLADAHFEFNG